MHVHRTCLESEGGSKDADGQQICKPGSDRVATLWRRARNGPMAHMSTRPDAHTAFPRTRAHAHTPTAPCTHPPAHVAWLPASGWRPAEDGATAAIYGTHG